MLHGTRPLLFSATVLLAVGLMLTSCHADGMPDETTSLTDPYTLSIETSLTPGTLPEVVMPEEPVRGTYTSSGETTIDLSDTTTAVTVEGEGVSVDGHTVTITTAGCYLISGSLSNGQIVVNTTDEEKVTLFLNGVSLACTDGPAVYVQKAPKKVVISTIDGSVNLLTDGSDYIVPDDQQIEGENYPNACIYACDDLTFDGHGTLYITGNADKGVNTKDDLTVTSGTIVVTSVGIGLRGNDSVEIRGGTVTVTSGGDGIKSANTDKAGKGFVLISGGTLHIDATGDGVSAATDLTMSGGTAGEITDGRVCDLGTYTGYDKIGSWDAQ